MDGITDAQLGQKLNEKAWGRRAGSRIPTPSLQPPAAEPEQQGTESGGEGSLGPL